MLDYEKELQTRISDERAAIELIKITSDLCFEKSIELWKNEKFLLTEVEGRLWQKIFT